MRLRLLFLTSIVLLTGFALRAEDDMQLGGSWVGAVDESTLPTAMHVDWVKFYHGSQNGKRFSEFVNPRKTPRK